jgi:DNA polymerase-3 subunit delta
LKLPADKLAGSLDRDLAPLYLVSGDEPLLVQESCDLIRSKLRDSGYSERDLFHVEGSFDWEQVLFSANSMSLFAEQKILEIRMPSGKPGDKGAAALKDYIEHMPDDTVMLLVLPRLDASTQKTKWFKALESAGVFVQVWPVSLGQMPRWLSGRFSRAGLKAEREAVEALIDRIEGNLLAAIQEIERLKLLSSDGTIRLKDIVEGVADSSRYDLFAFIDAAVEQDATRTLKIAQGLRMEGAEILYVTAMLAREVRSLSAMAAKIESGQSVDSAIQAGRVWQKRKPMVQRCLRVHRLSDFLDMEKRIAEVDKMVKGLAQGDPWNTLTGIALSLAGRPLRAA